ncbi:MAG: hypothetical protein EOM83_13045 [Clostridia bacterium]|nr:hypothetical protein [Clostridia bacterium]
MDFLFGRQYGLSAISALRRDAAAIPAAQRDLSLAGERSSSSSKVSQAILQKKHHKYNISCPFYRSFFYRGAIHFSI